MDDAMGKQDGLNEFLMSISEVKDFQLNEEDRRPQRIQIYWAIHKRLVELLVAEDLADEWLLQLIELECEGENAPDKASHIARLLTSYVVNRPWIFHPKATPRKPRGSKQYVRPQIAVSTQSKKFISDYDNLAELRDHQVMHATTKAARNDYLEEIPQRKSAILADSDSILGMAGFSPIEQAPELDAHGSKQSMSSLAGNLKMEEQYVSQYRSHIQLTGDSSRKCARVSFLPHNGEDDEVKLMFSITHAMLSVDHGVESLASQINILQEPGHFDKLYFIRSRSNGNENIPPEKYQHYAEVASIDVDKIWNFIHAYGETRKTFGFYLSRLLKNDERRLQLVSILAVYSAIASSPITIYPIFGAVFGGVFWTAMTLATLITIYPLFFPKRLLDSWAVTGLSPLLKTMEPILESLAYLSLIQDKALKQLNSRFFT